MSTPLTHRRIYTRISLVAPGGVAEPALPGPDSVAARYQLLEMQGELRLLETDAGSIAPDAQPNAVPLVPLGTIVDRNTLRLGTQALAGAHSVLKTPLMVLKVPSSNGASQIKKKAAKRPRREKAMLFEDWHENYSEDLHSDDDSPSRDDLELIGFIWDKFHFKTKPTRQLTEEH